MRALLENEWAVVAGGQDTERTECLERMKSYFIVIGGAAGGLSAGPPGLLVGATAGSLAADVLAPYSCQPPEEQEEDDEKAPSEEELHAQLMSNPIRPFPKVDPDTGKVTDLGPQQLYVDTRYGY